MQKPGQMNDLGTSRDIFPTSRNMHLGVLLSNLRNKIFPASNLPLNIVPTNGMLRTFHMK